MPSSASAAAAGRRLRLADGHLRREHPARECAAAAVPDAVDALHDLPRGRRGLLLQLLGSVGRRFSGDRGKGLVSGDITLQV